MRSLGLAAIVEGIERQGQLDELIALGFRFGQGFLLGRPEPADPSSVRSSHPRATRHERRCGTRGARLRPARRRPVRCDARLADDRLPFGPKAWQPEPLGLPDTVASADELTLVALLGAAPLRRSLRSAIVALGVALILLSSLTLVSGGHGH